MSAEARKAYNPRTADDEGETKQRAQEELSSGTYIHAIVSMPSIPRYNVYFPCMISLPTAAARALDGVVGRQEKVKVGSPCFRTNRYISYAAGTPTATTKGRQRRRAKHNVPTPAHRPRATPRHSPRATPRHSSSTTPLFATTHQCSTINEQQRATATEPDQSFLHQSFLHQLFLHRSILHQSLLHR